MRERVLLTLAGTALFMAAASVQADWFRSNNNGWDDGDWPEWTPMYWMDEMFNDNNRWNGPWNNDNRNGWNSSFNPNFSVPSFNQGFSGPNGGPGFDPRMGPVPPPPAGYYGMPVPYGVPNAQMMPPPGYGPGSIPNAGMPMMPPPGMGLPPQGMMVVPPPPGYRPPYYPPMPGGQPPVVMAPPDAAPDPVMPSAPVVEQKP